MDLLRYVASQGSRNYSFYRWINCPKVNLVFYAHILLREHHLILFVPSARRAQGTLVSRIRVCQ